jgi:WD40 repeat protein
VEEAAVTPQRYQRLCELFDQAQSLPSAERAAFLQQACADDSSLRAELEKLLNHDRQACRELLLRGPCPVNARVLLSADAPVTLPGAPLTAEPEDGLPGRTIGPYVIEQRLGCGGMGVVYQARQTALGRTVALKMIRAGAHAGSEERRRFKAEAAAVARLQHPNIVQIHEVGEADGLPYFSLEFCPGGSLADRLRGEPLPPREAARVAEALAQAVEAAHAVGIVHRDLKPANVLLAADGTPKISDFGLAKWLDGQPGQTASGAVVGTPSYMAPEQAGGKNREVGPATDVYALGAILYELLTGRPPFRAANPLDTLLLVVSAEPVPPSRLQPGVPRDLEAVVLKCLEKDSARRYPTAHELAEDLRRFGAGESVQARPVGAAERGLRWARRRPAVAGLLAVSAILTLLLLAGGVALVFDSQVRDLNGRLRVALAQAEKAQQGEMEQRERAQVLLYFMSIERAHSAWRENDVQRADDILETCDPEQRRWEWYYVHRLCHSELLALKGHTHFVNSVAFSPDNSRLASASSDLMVKIWDARSGQETFTLKGHTSSVQGVAWSPDGTRLASASYDKTLKVWDTGTGQEALTLKGHTNVVNGVAWSPDGTRLASASNDGTVKVWDARTGQEALSLKGHRSWVMGVAFNLDGTRLASASADQTVRVWDARSGQGTLILQGHTDAVLSVAWSPDGTRLASASRDTTVKVWDANLGQVTHTLMGHTARVRGVAWSPDGTQLASASDDKMAKVWDAKSGQETRTPQKHTGMVFGVAWSPDGTRLASASQDRTVKVWDAQTGQEALTLKGHTDFVMGVAFSSDGTRLASAGGKLGIPGEVKVWDTRTGREVLTLKGHTNAVRAVAWSPDGSRLASASHDQTVKVWDAQTGQEARTLKGHTDAVRAVAWSPDGSRLASASYDKTVKVWDAQTGQEERTLKGHTDFVLCVVFSPDGSRLASASDDGTLKVWDAQTGLEALTFKGHTKWISGVAWSPDGTRLASASGDGTGSVWDVGTGTETSRLKGHTGGVASVVFNPDGTRLATASGDRTVKIWDARTGQDALTLRGHTGDVSSVAWSPDGTQLASASFDKTVNLWPASPLPQQRP